MPLKNPYGDFEITDPQALRALAHPVRIGILDRLQRHGPATATQLAEHVDASPSVVSWHLRHLAGFGLVKDWDGATSKRERWWEAAHRGIRFGPSGTAEAQAAARQLQDAFFAQYATLPEQWLATDEPRLTPEWRRLAGMANTLVVVTEEELRELLDAIEALMTPYVRRKAKRPPKGARGVRLLRYVLPEADA